MKCPNCKRKWSPTSQQSLAVEVLGQCLMCRKIVPADIAKVAQAKRERQMTHTETR